MGDLKKYVDERKKRDREFAEGFDESYAQFKIGATLRKTREAAGENDLRGGHLVLLIWNWRYRR